MSNRTLLELATLTESELIGNPDYIIQGVDELESATPSDISFFSNIKYRNLFNKTNAGAICVARNTKLVEGKNYLISDNPSATFQKLISYFIQTSDSSGFSGIHLSVRIGKEVHIGPLVVIDKNCVIGDRTRIDAGSCLSTDVTLGENCIIHSNATIREGSKLGNRVIIQSGAIIGGCGFGYITNERGKHTKVTHLGTVVLEDDVEIGSNTTIDRGRFKETRIKKGSKIDNLVMIAHNACIGEDNLVVAQSGIAGSSKTGKRVILAAQSGMVGHIEIADDVILMARGAFSKSVKEKGAYGGAPAIPLKEYHEQAIHAKRLADYVSRIKSLEKKTTSPLESPC